ncbi:MAG: hypothetical protein JRE58_01035 [Deltaproteobacteria bacterium]|nr:hypothetical protein [Deltaproteobacteria bacterium]MBW2591586.1 hypothetical protein [Deltaproteobacteria bacterium]
MNREPITENGLEPGGCPPMFLFFRKKGAQLLLALAVALVICGCGRKGPPLSPAFAPAAEIQQTRSGGI